jgi:hypothetical protein
MQGIAGYVTAWYVEHCIGPYAPFSLCIPISFPRAQWYSNLAAMQGQSVRQPDPRDCPFNDLHQKRLGEKQEQPGVRWPGI